MSELSNPSFDYESISKQEASKLRYFEGQLVASRKRVAEEVIRHGEILHGAQEVLANHAGGVFGAWLDAVGISRRAAYLAIASFTQFGGCANLHNLEVSAMYELTKSEQAKKRALKLMEKGVNVTYSMAEKLLKEAAAKTIKRESGKDDRTESEPARTAKESAPEPPRNGTEKPGELLDEPIRAEQTEIDSVVKCPNCAGVKWEEDDDGSHCARCHHPFGEPAGEVDEDRIDIQRMKAIKTAEALMRAFDDLQVLLPRKKEHAAVIEQCKVLLNVARAWK